jgi:hypothetical protein
MLYLTFPQYADRRQRSTLKINDDVQTYRYKKPRKAVGDCYTSELSLELVDKYSTGMLRMELDSCLHQNMLKECLATWGWEVRKFQGPYE